jgi:integrase
LCDTASPATINCELAAVRRAFRLAVLQGLLLMAPPVPGLRENNVRTGFFEPEQFEAVCRRLKDVEADLVRFCYHTGWRTKSEVFPLTWAQVDWIGGLVRLEPGTKKNGEGRAFPITPELRVLLEREKMKVLGENMVFVRRGATAYMRGPVVSTDADLQTLNEIVDAFLEALSIREASP